MKSDQSHIAQSQTRGQIQDFLLFFIPLALLIGLGMLHLGHLQQQDLRQHEFDDEDFSVRIASERLTLLVQRPLQHLHSLSVLERNGWYRPDESERAHRTALQQRFTTVMQRNPAYLQVRWIGPDGMERVRLDQTTPGQIRVTPDAALQDKRDRHYTTVSQQLQPGEAYVSPLDLNVENGRIETPHRPTLRVSQGVFDAQGRRLGFLIINLAVGQYLQDFLRYERSGSQLMLLNSDGYWLQHHDPARTWGFQLDATQSMARQLPGLWAQLGASASGHSAGEDGLWAWQRVELASYLQPLQQAPQWLAVSFRPNAQLAEQLTSLWWQIAEMAGGLLLLAAAAAAALARASAHQRQSALDRQQRRLLTEANQHLDAALQARTTELRAANEHLNQQQQFILSITDNVPGLIAYVDAARQTTFANARRAEWLGDAPLLEQLRPDDDAQWQAVRQGRPVRFEKTLRRGDTEPPLALQIDLIPDPRNGHDRGLFVLATDISRLKQTEAALAQRAEEADAANRAKSEFLANMSHEIRTPMNGMLGLCYLLERQPLNAESRRMLRQMQGSGQTLLAIINDILDFSRIEARQMKLEQVPFQLDEVLDRVADILAVAIADKPIEPLVAPTPPGARYLLGDALRLGQILTNLVGNAAKFTARGEIALEVGRLDNGETPDRVRLRFAVHDTGIGIAQERQSAIFQAFTQADSSTTRRYGGSGLGLTICHRLVELMGGALQLASQPDVGSVFSFELDFALSVPIDNALPGLTHQRLLIVDDQARAREVMAATAMSMGWQTEQADSGQAALACLQGEWPDEFDVIVLDWRMPDCDGLEVLRRIRAAEKTLNQHPIIIMVTAHDRAALQQTPESGLLDGVLTKPVTASSLFDAVLAARQRRGELVLPDGTLKDDPAIAGLRVLLVDDSEVNRVVAHAILGSEGALVEEAENGQVALDLLRQDPQRCDVVLMDVQMPVLDGCAATRQIRASAALRHLPVVALTAGAFNEQREQALDAGMTAFVAKPFEPRQLMQVLRGLASKTQPISQQAQNPHQEAC